MHTTKPLQNGDSKNDLKDKCRCCEGRLTYADVWYNKEVCSTCLRKSKSNIVTFNVLNEGDVFMFGGSQSIYKVTLVGDNHVYYNTYAKDRPGRKWVHCNENVYLLRKNSQ